MWMGRARSRRRTWTRCVRQTIQTFHLLTCLCEALVICRSWGRYWEFDKGCARPCELQGWWNALPKWLDNGAGVSRIAA